MKNSFETENFLFNRGWRIWDAERPEQPPAGVTWMNKTGRFGTHRVGIMPNGFVQFQDSTANGLIRNLARFTVEGQLTWAALTGAGKRLLTLEDGLLKIPSNLIDLFVEPLRAAPFLWGHILFLLSVLDAAWNLYRWLG